MEFGRAERGMFFIGSIPYVGILVIRKTRVEIVFSLFT